MNDCVTSKTMQTAISQIEANPHSYMAQNNFSAELEKQQPSTQLTIIKDLLKKHPDHPWLMQQYAFALSNNGDHLLAVKMWSGWIMGCPGQYDIQSGLCAALTPLPPKQQADILKDLLQSHPNSLFLQKTLAVAYADAKNYHESIQLLTKCLQKCDGDAQKAKFEDYLATLYQATGNFEQYRMILERTLVRDPSNPKAKLRLCKLLISTGDLDTSITICLEAIPQSSKLEFIDILAGALELRNEPEVSVEIWKGLLSKTWGAGDGNEKAKHISVILESSAAVAIRTWKDLVIEQPNQSSFLRSLSSVIEASTDPIVAVSTWKDLCLAHPDKSDFFNRLLRALGAISNFTLTINTLKDLTMAHFEKALFYDNLRNALEASDEKDIEASVWRDLAISHPSHTSFRKELKRAEAKQAGIDVEAACSICWDQDMDTVFYCGHTCCFSCATQITKCPECRKDIEGRVKVYARMYHR